MASDSQPNTVTRDCTATHDDDPTPAPVATLRSGAAQRQWQYRQQRKRAFIEAIGNEAAASRVTLVALLAHELGVLEARSTTPEIEPARNSARRVLSEIITRYAIEL